MYYLKIYVENKEIKTMNYVTMHFIFLQVLDIPTCDFLACFIQLCCPQPNPWSQDPKGQVFLPRKHTFYI